MEGTCLDELVVAFTTLRNCAWGSNVRRSISIPTRTWLHTVIKAMIALLWTVLVWWAGDHFTGSPTGAQQDVRAGLLRRNLWRALTLYIASLCIVWHALTLYIAPMCIVWHALTLYSSHVYSLACPYTICSSPVYGSSYVIKSTNSGFDWCYTLPDSHVWVSCLCAMWSVAHVHLSFLLFMLLVCQVRGTYIQHFLTFTLTRTWIRFFHTFSLHRCALTRDSV